VDAALGAVVALGAITLAHAAKPDRVVLTSHVQSTAVTLDIPPDTFVPETLIAFEQPVPGRAIISPFGLRKMPWEARARLHAGIDIAAERGARVIAVADGIVVDRGASPTYGRYVELRHAEGLSTLYAHLGGIDIDMAKGVRVRAGEIVGRVGTSGVSTGPHLHFEIRDRKDRPLNPTLFLGRTFTEADDLPLRMARGVGRRVRVAQVSRIPASKKAMMRAGQGVASQPVDGMESVKVSVAEDGRPRAQLTL
jgi:murein DD-endopeptidase MepM/ murein hydrolase activator NlpD